MTGLCGWIGFGTDGWHHQDLIERMAGALTPGEEPVIVWRGRHDHAVAVVGRNSGLHQNPHSIFAIDGHPLWTDAALARLAAQEGHAAALAAAYAQHGNDFLKLLQGSFALAILHPEAREAVIAVDRMGIRPLAYALRDGCLVFGSTTDSVGMHPLVDHRIDPQSILDYLYFNMVPSPRTIYSSQNKLEPAQMLHYRRGQLQTEYYWRPHFFEGGSARAADLAAELKDLLRSAVERLDPDCRAGAFLSGGLDSSTVSGILSKVCPPAAHTYSIGFEAEGYDEIAYARIAARHFHTVAHEYYVTPEDVAIAVPLIARRYDEPFGNSSAIPVYYCARLAQQDGRSLLLAGDGGDEIFAGNPHYGKQKVFELYSAIPRAVRGGLLEPAVNSIPRVERIPLLKKVHSYIRQAKIPLPDRLESYNMLHLAPLEDIFEPEFLGTVDPQRPLRQMREVYARAGTESAIDSMLFLDWKFTLADNDLRKVNRMCEAVGIEVRYPMLDQELVEFSTRVPPSLKLKGFTLRHFYKQALRDYLPAEIIRKRKHGFGLPFGVWLRSSPRLQELMRASMESFRQRGYLRPGFVDRMVREHEANHAGFYGSMLWTLMMLELWLEAHPPPAQLR
jgi:asparagine synthase (glutamine-hydrolysing)